MRYHGHENYHEIQRGGAELPKDAQGRTMIPRVEDIHAACETVTRLKREAEERNLAERRWSQR